MYKSKKIVSTQIVSNDLAQRYNVVRPHGVTKVRYEGQSVSNFSQKMQIQMRKKKNNQYRLRLDDL